MRGHHLFVYYAPTLGILDTETVDLRKAYFDRIPTYSNCQEGECPFVGWHILPTLRQSGKIHGDRLPIEQADH